MNCDSYLELLSARLDGELTEAEERELKAHLESCPACRAAGTQLAALRPAFAGLEELPASEGFARDVMDRIRKSEPHKTVPLFKRPRFRALAGLAACAVLAVGLYGVVRQPQQDCDQITRSYHQDALEKIENIPAGEILRSVPDLSTTAAGPDTDTPGHDGAAAIPAAPVVNAEILVVDHMPEGGWELIPPETPVSADGLHVTGELLEQIRRLAQDQGITASITSGTEGAENHLLVVLEGTE